MRANRRGPGPEAIFERFDADGDGSVTEAEFERGRRAIPRAARRAWRPFGNRDRG
jgi:hypothetical protein